MYSIRTVQRKVSFVPEWIEMTNRLSIEVLMRYLREANIDKKGHLPTATAVAEKTGLAISTITKYINGERENVGRNELLAISNAYGFDPAYWFSESEAEARSFLAHDLETRAAVESFIIAVAKQEHALPDNADTHKFVEALRQLDDTGRETVMRIAATNAQQILILVQRLSADPD